MHENGHAYKTISNYKRSMKVIFYTAIQDDCVRKNPFDFNISDILEDDIKPKEVITPEQEESLLQFAEHDKIYKKKQANQCRPPAFKRHRNRVLY